MQQFDFEELKPSWYYKNRHLQTILPTLFRKLKPVDYQRFRLELSDGDFVDLDFKKNGSKKLCLILHGLESSSSRNYMLGMINSLPDFDCCAMNFRGCSSEDNRKLQTYHSGKTDDVLEALNYLQNVGYQEINLVGFSLGGNVLLKLLGEINDENKFKINNSVAISVPLDLASTSRQLESFSNIIYEKKFLKSFKRKLSIKKKAFPDALEYPKIENANSIEEFDQYFTAKINGFESAQDYYQQNSSIHFLTKIRTKTLIINALNDPFLTPECYPNHLNLQNNKLYFFYPNNGGHVGFYQNLNDEIYYHEKIVGHFLRNQS